MRGNVKFFNPAKSFGFIVGEDKKEYFFNSGHILDEDMLHADDAVIFEPQKAAKGPVATEIHLEQ